jgi:uncharacterized membrane protein YoaK (UPF0700 family)
MDTTLHTPETIYSPRHVPSWLMLAASAGAVNGFAFTMCEQYVTHLSGSFTELGLKSWRASIVLDSAAVILSFIAGAFASIVMLHSRAVSGDRPRWATPLVSVTVLLIAVAAAGRAGLFGSTTGGIRRCCCSRCCLSRWERKTPPSLPPPVLPSARRM